jgi:hypothetical protein
MKYDGESLGDEHNGFGKRRLKHSGMDIASSVCVFVAVLLTAVVLVAARIIDACTPGGMNEESPIALIMKMAIQVPVGYQLRVAHWKRQKTVPPAADQAIPNRQDFALDGTATQTPGTGMGPSVRSKWCAARRGRHTKPVGLLVYEQ